MSGKKERFDKILHKIEDVLEEEHIEVARREICQLLKENIDYYNWVGFYLSDENGYLTLTEFEGEPTIHTKIRFGEGICGQAAETKRTFLTNDVSKETNYLSCSIKVKSEIVVPIMQDSRFIGELDIDSHKLNAFDELDKEFLEKICGLISERTQLKSSDQR